MGLGHKNTKIFLLFSLASGFIFLLWNLLQGQNIQLFNPQGIIARQQMELIITATLLMLVVVLPVIVMTFYISWKYRAQRKEEYAPNWDRDPKLQLVWWGFPALIIIAIAAMTWQSSHALDPYKRIENNTKPITIQVVALEWKWLFIYPEQKIATVNYLEIPQKTPVHLELTADAPMNSFWIPQLGGQMYAMAGMATKLNLMADTTGEFPGSAAEINGKGFSGMNFLTKSTTKNEFDTWVLSVKKSSEPLTQDKYNELSKPSENNARAFYASAEHDLFNSIIMKYMNP
ncbi:MAG: ubiquinol oxidase subunit II [Candidatus Doudnabacteria bacterium]|nr:ubiquinol oxidase subunit II [Candidatus Doudnabacteria bacterium]